ncbi:hypothetical protein [Streptomyces canarius]
MTLIALDESAEPTVIAALSEREWDVVVIGGRDLASRNLWPPLASTRS